MSMITEDNSSNDNAACAELDAFQQLVESLREALGPFSGIDSADVDPTHLQYLMKGYVSRPSEWKKYALSDMSRSYTRNLVDKGNGKSNLVRTRRSAETASCCSNGYLQCNSSYWCGIQARVALYTTIPMHIV